MCVEVRKKVAICIQYDGTRYFGWQRQHDVPTVQTALEEALTMVANHSVSTVGAGRTDAGVHSLGQIIHFETTAIRTIVSWTRGVNSYLPKDIAVRWVQNVPSHFHARFSAISRHYRYVIYNHLLRPALLNSRVLHYPLPLDYEVMHRAGQYLLGENDYTTFRSLHCQSRTPYRNIMYLNVSRYDSYIIVDMKANSFLQHMVRNIVGCLIEIGSGKQPEEWMSQILAAKKRTLAASTAKAEGLYLVSIDYPEHFLLPKITLGPLFITI
ncbi:MAG: tRNA pseudouridine(38-40) synthase TruA [Candidatus Dasytiphilus stammeri]